ncbi:hypothetical protein EJ06DRAFT_373158 [Trichodelitschia bisporula]|uniref:Uncharacterized protein n=1 Tax=Trichodelitschia bisporula TaxID=703511 RepID=A0A6G1I1B5_9PEZI|nr:hypothetical protein EJ06DRAFT_373158 [Trichodelitschia bisporula]
MRLEGARCGVVVVGWEVRRLMDGGGWCRCFVLLLVEAPGEGGRASSPHLLPLPPHPASPPLSPHPELPATHHHPSSNSRAKADLAADLFTLRWGARNEFAGLWGSRCDGCICWRRSVARAVMRCRQARSWGL